MTRARCIGGVVLILSLVGGAAAATNVGLGVGLDPTGIFLINALTELPISANFDVRAELGVATGNMAGLMLVTAGILAHQEFPPFDPFLVLGAGVALTPPPFTTGLVLEATAGVRIALLDALALFTQARFIVRWLEGGFTSGPVYEAGIEVRF